MARYFSLENLDSKPHRVDDEDIMQMMPLTMEDTEIYIKDEDDGTLFCISDADDDTQRSLREHHGIYVDEDGALHVRDFNYGLDKVSDEAFDKDGNKIAYDGSRAVDIVPMYHPQEEGASYYDTKNDDFIFEIDKEDYEDAVNSYDPERIAPTYLYGVADKVDGSDFDLQGNRVPEGERGEIGERYLLVTGESGTGDYQIEVKERVDYGMVTTVDSWISRYDNDNPEKVIKEFCERNGYKYTEEKGEVNIAEKSELTFSEKFMNDHPVPQDDQVQKGNGRRL